jgi:hypothetical protein
MHHVIGYLVIGALGGITVPRAKVRPALRGLVRNGMLAGRKKQDLGATARSEVNKLVDEARADLDQASGEQHS